MRLKLTCQVQHPGQYLPLNHQYELSSYIYHRLAEADPDFSKMLHDQGFGLEGSTGKKFKLFTFSNVFVPKGKGRLKGSRLQVFAREVEIEVSFLLDRAAQHFMIGAFMNDSFGIGNRDGVLDLRVTGVQLLATPDFNSGRAELLLISPAVVSRPVTTEQGRLSHDYLRPDDEAYERYFVQNLLRKYDTARQHGLLEGPEVSPEEIRLRVSTPERAKRKPRTLRIGKPDETRIIGYQYRFTLQAPPKVLQLGYLAGWGELNAQGFGMGKIAGKNQDEV